MKVKWFPVSFPLFTGSLLFVAAAVFLFSSCAPKTTPDPQPQHSAIAVIDMNKALQSHPKFQERLELQKKLNTLLASQQALASQKAAAEDLSSAQTPAATPPLTGTAGQDPQLQQQYQAKMMAKHTELQTAFDGNMTALRKKSSDDYNAFSTALDKEYQPAMFDIQLKLQALQLSKEAAQELQDKLTKLRQEKDDRLAAKEKQLSADLAAQLAAAQKAAAAELDRYGQQIAAQLHSAAASAPQPVTAALQADLSVPSQDKSPAAPASLPSDDLTEIDQLKAQMTALENSMIADIENQAGKIALAKGYEIVITDVTANLNADDITAEVIAQFSK